jgi:predicted membrane-bound mannosyltransferase
VTENHSACSLPTSGPFRCRLPLPWYVETLNYLEAAILQSGAES